MRRIRASSNVMRSDVGYAILSSEARHAKRLTALCMYDEFQSDDSFAASSAAF